MSALPDLIREAAEPLIGSPSDYDSLLERVGDARFVLLGEASHGTHECMAKDGEPLAKRGKREARARGLVSSAEETISNPRNLCRSTNTSAANATRNLAKC